MWFYILRNKKMGPVSEEQIRTLLGSGKLLPESLVWRDGLKDWTPVSETGLIASCPPELPESIKRHRGKPTLFTRAILFGIIFIFLFTWFFGTFGMMWGFGKNALTLTLLLATTLSLCGGVIIETQGSTKPLAILSSYKYPLVFLLIFYLLLLSTLVVVLGWALGSFNEKVFPVANFFGVLSTLAFGPVIGRKTRWWKTSDGR